MVERPEATAIEYRNVLPTSFERREPPALQNVRDADNASTKTQIAT
jgi:hypothetical protein